MRAQGAPRLGGTARAAPSRSMAPWSCRAILIAATALGVDDLGEGVDGGARIGMGIEPAAAFGADAAPLADQQSAAEQVGPDLQAVEAPFVEFRPDADQRGGLGEQRQLDRARVARGEFCGVWATSHGKCITSGTIRVGPSGGYPRKSGQGGECWTPS